MMKVGGQRDERQSETCHTSCPYDCLCCTQPLINPHAKTAGLLIITIYSSIVRVVQRLLDA